MNSVWERLHTWLHANAPAGFGDLRAGAGEEAVAEAERAMFLRLPDDVTASYRIHDGQAREPGLIGGEGWWLLPLRNVVETWHRWSRANPADTRRVPLACNPAGDFVFLNLAPSAEGSEHVMIQRADTVDPDPLAPSFRAWLEGFVDELEDDVFVYSEGDGELMLADDAD